MISPITRPTAIPHAGHPEYLERVYAGVLGKIIGVYLGRPVEGWSNERIESEFGEVDRYLHEERGRRLIVTDDDISGTFTFLRALEDNDFDPNLSAEAIGETWLNYLIERTTILWWGGMGNSTEHTAYLRLKSGVKAPESGSEKRNGKVMAEQIGAQIFIDGWGFVCPGDPAKAVEFARRAASVSHDGEAIYGAQVVAALVAQAFVESDIGRLLDESVRHIPADCVIRSLIGDLRDWVARDGSDWRATRRRLDDRYGYHKFRGNCHMVPNHGLIILGLLAGGGDFDRSLMIVNTCGWDTDCNSGNLGAILGVRNGLSGLGARDWRGPVADRLYLPSADGGRAITDAVSESLTVANAGRSLAGLPRVSPKSGARFHFTFLGSTQGWRAEGGDGILENRNGRLVLTSPVVASTPTFIPPDTKDMVTGYVLVANPTLYPGQVVTASLTAEGHATGQLFLEHYQDEDGSIRVDGPAFLLEPGEEVELRWAIPETGGFPIHRIGVRVTDGEVTLDCVDWRGVPRTSWPPVAGTMWARAWAKALDRFEFARDGYGFLNKDSGIGMLIQGHREWEDYRIEAEITPQMAKSAGIAVRVHGLRRYQAFVFAEPGRLRWDLATDGVRTIMAESAFNWIPFETYSVAVEARGEKLSAFINGDLVLDATSSPRLRSGAFAFFVEEGCFGAKTPSISPL